MAAICSRIDTTSCGKRVHCYTGDCTHNGIPHNCGGVLTVSSEELPKKLENRRNTFIKDKINKNKPRWEK